MKVSHTKLLSKLSVPFQEQTESESKGYHVRCSLSHFPLIDQWPVLIASQERKHKQKHLKQKTNLNAPVQIWVSW